MECQQPMNLESCTCGSTNCPRHGICCDCLRHHMGRRQLPRCAFPLDADIPDRSFETFAKMIAAGQI